MKKILNFIKRIFLKCMYFHIKMEATNNAFYIRETVKKYLKRTYSEDNINYRRELFKLCNELKMSEVHTESVLKVYDTFKVDSTDRKALTKLSKELNFKHIMFGVDMSDDDCKLLMKELTA